MVRLVKVSVFSAIIYFEKKIHSLISCRKTLTKQQYARKKIIIGLCTYFEFLIMDQ